MDRFKESLDRHITGNYGEDQISYADKDSDENNSSFNVLERGFKPVAEGTKCSYKNCPNAAVCYKYGGQGGWNCCEAHGGKKVTKEEKF